MKISGLAVAALLPFAAFSAPTAEPNVDIAAPVALEKRAVTGTVTSSALKYRTCPQVASYCKVIGQYSKGARISMSCQTTQWTTPVEGNR
jgi:hypothetical protein